MRPISLPLVTLSLALGGGLAPFGTLPASADNVKVEVCHVPSGNERNAHSISVSAAALQAHLKHGDTEGACPGVCENLCGNGVIDPGEQCDTDNLNGEGCDSQGHPFGGTLTCGVGCQLDTSACAPVKLVFLTSHFCTGTGVDEVCNYTGDLGGLDGADAICQRHADTAGLSGVYRAWIGDGTDGPLTRFNRSTVPYVRTDGVTVALDFDDLLDSPMNPIIADEFGVIHLPVPDGESPRTHPFGTSWTNVSSTGQSLDEPDCNNWTSDSPDRTGLWGSATATTSDWIRSKTKVSPLGAFKDLDERRGLAAPAERAASLGRSVWEDQIELPVYDGHPVAIASALIAAAALDVFEPSCTRDQFAGAFPDREFTFLP